MKWRGERQSGNVEDRRGMGPAKGGIASGGGTLLRVVALAVSTGTIALEVLDAVGGPGAGAPAEQGTMGAPTDELGQFASTVLASTEDVWTQVFTAQGVEYKRPTLVLFEQAVASACG